ncbi:hypothetical protein Tco_1578145 [Tanacetum coccineum]
MLFISECSIGRFWNNCFNSGIDIWDCNMIYSLKECESSSRVLIGGSDRKLLRDISKRRRFLVLSTKMSMKQKMFSDGMLYLVYVASMSLFYAYVILMYLASLCMAYLKELAYGDGLMQADWSHLALMIQSMLLFLNKF